MARSTPTAAAQAAARRLAHVTLAATALSTLGCDDEKPKSRADAGVDAGAAGPVLDGELAAAVAAAAASASAKPTANAAAGDGPPETGVFAPGKADQLLGRGKAPKVELLGEGAEPRVPLAPRLDAAGEQKTRVVVALRMGPQSALPTIEFDVLTKVDKWDDKEKKDGKDGRDDRALKTETADGAFVTTRVTGAKLAAKQPGALPKELEAEVAKLKGGLIRCEMVRSGGVIGCNTSLPKGANDGLDGALKALADALTVMRLAAPDKPVGVGAYWMVTDRTTIGAVAGIDGLRYRVFKVESIEKGKVRLSIDVRQYAATDAFEQPGAPKGPPMSIDAVESQGKGAIGVTPGSLVPDTGDMTVKLNARMRVGQGNQRPVVQLETSSRIGDAAPAADD